MPSPLQIRKNLLQALDESILSLLQAPQAPHFILAELPIHVPKEITVTHLPIPLLEDEGAGAANVSQIWSQVRLNSYYQFYLAFLFQGQADLRLGTTIGMAQAAKVRNLWTRTGCHVLHLHAPSFVMFPPGVPYSNGGLHWENTRTPPPDSKILWMHMSPNGALCHFCNTENGAHRVEHSLLIQDAAAPVIISLLTNELRRGERSHEAIAGNYLLTLLQCLQRNLLLHAPVIGNTAWLPAPEVRNAGQATSAERTIREADRFVQMHLHESISLPQIAAHCGISPSHLNLLFRTDMGISAKRFVNYQRIRAAQRMLFDSDAPVKEIARLVGFSQTSHFCQVFQRVTLMSPGQFRAQNKPPAI